MKTRLFQMVSFLLLFVAGCGAVQPLQDLESQKDSVRTAILTGSTTFPGVTGIATITGGSNKGPRFEGRVRGASTLVGQVLGVYAENSLITSTTIIAGGDGQFKIFGAPVAITEFFGTPIISVRTSTGVVVASGVMNF